MKARQFSVMFVCLGNICRSPFAETAFRKIARQTTPECQWISDSSGLIDFHAGNPADSRMISHAAKKGYRIDTRAKKFRKERDLRNFDLILGMDASVYRDLKSTIGPEEKGDKNKIRLFTEFCSPPDSKGIPDPYYGGADGFDSTIRKIENGCQGLLRYVQENF